MLMSLSDPISVHPPSQEWSHLLKDHVARTVVLADGREIAYARQIAYARRSGYRRSFDAGAPALRRDPRPSDDCGCRTGTNQSTTKVKAIWI